VRTVITRWWSSIQSAAVRIGDDVFEVKAGIQDRPYWINGEEGRFMTSMPFPFTLGGFEGRYRYISDRVIQYKIFLNDHQNITIRSVKDMLRIEMEGSDLDDYGESLGLMGSFNGDLVGRDGTTIFTDTNEFGLHWQVNPSVDGQLFLQPEGRQFPEKCAMPSTTATSTSRRLRGTISKEAAERACAGVPGDQEANCVFDVMAMDDVDAALNY